MKESKFKLLLFFPGTDSHAFDGEKYQSQEKDSPDDMNGDDDDLDATGMVTFICYIDLFRVNSI